VDKCPNPIVSNPNLTNLLTPTPTLTLLPIATLAFAVFLANHFTNVWPYAIGLLSVLSCLFCLSVTLVYCGQTAGSIKMPLGTEVGLGPGDIVLDGDPALSPKMGTAAPTFHPVSIVTKRSPISATAELLLAVLCGVLTPTASAI